MSEENRLKCTFLTLSKDQNSPVIANLGFLIISMDLYLAKCKLVRKKDGTCYIAPPSEEYLDPKTGKNAYANFFWFGSKTSDFFQKEALKAIKSYCLGKGIADPTLFQLAQREPPTYSTQNNEYRGSNETQLNFANVGTLANSMI